MSDIGNTPVTPPGAPARPPEDAPPPRNGCLTAFMVIIGILLLLPGLCAGFFAVSALTTHFESGFTGFIVFGLLVGFCGILLIRAAIRGPRG